MDFFCFVNFNFGIFTNELFCIAGQRLILRLRATFTAICLLLFGIWYLVFLSSANKAKNMFF